MQEVLKYLIHPRVKESRKICNCIEGENEEDIPSKHTGVSISLPGKVASKAHSQGLV
jgi:hypothetical protein